MGESMARLKNGVVDVAEEVHPAIFKCADGRCSSAKPNEMLPGPCPARLEISGDLKMKVLQLLCHRSCLFHFSPPVPYFSPSLSLSY